LFAIRREKTFGPGRAIRLDRNARARVIAFARARIRQAGRGRPACTLEVFRALLSYLGNNSGRCFPSYEAIAARAGCHRSTVAEALKVLESAKAITWTHRLVKVRERVRDLFGVEYSRWRVLRTSNSYRFIDPKRAVQVFPTGKRIEESIRYSSLSAPDPRSPLEHALACLGAAVSKKLSIEQGTGPRLAA
jgi:hypothetical protein